MTNQNNRDATATIRGYIYQFDATILKFLNADEDASILIEGIEDFDVLALDSTEYCQCKYYSSKKFTPKAIRDALLPMLYNYKQRVSATRLGAYYYQIYGYFQESQPTEETLKLEELKDALIKKEQVIDPSTRKKSWKVRNFQDELGLTDDDLDDFRKKLTIHISEEYSGWFKSPVEIGLHL